MTAPTVIPGTSLLILLGTGGGSPGDSPDVFVEPCGLTVKAFNLNANMNTTIVPDCTTPSAAAWEAKDVNSLSAEVTGNGIMAAEAFHSWNDWFLSAASRTARIQLTSPTTLPLSLGYWLGTFFLSRLQFNGQRGQKVLIDITMVNDGAITFVAA